VRPRPFSNLFYVASKPAGSKDHDEDLSYRARRMAVKQALRRLYSGPVATGRSGFSVHSDIEPSYSVEGSRKTSDSTNQVVAA
jgi:hypothetical protein